MLRLPDVVEFDWDDGNRDKNWLKHGVANAEAEEAFFDSLKLIVADAIHSSGDEARYILFGQTSAGRCLTVVFTLREVRVRVISARDMSRKERSLYEEANRTAES